MCVFCGFRGSENVVVECFNWAVTIKRKKFVLSFVSRILLKSMISFNDKFSLTYSEIKKLSRRYNIIPVYKEILADCETPVSAYLKISEGQRYIALLESVEGTERWGRYSFIVHSPESVIVAKGNNFSIFSGDDYSRAKNFRVVSPVEELKKFMSRYKPLNVKGLPRFWGGAVGYFSYDIVRYIEDLPCPPKSGLSLPDMFFLITNNMIVFDHLMHTIKVISCIDLRDKKLTYQDYLKACENINETIEKIRKTKTHSLLKGENKQRCFIHSTMTKNRFERAVKITKRYIRKGDVVQVVLSQRFDVKTSVEPFSVYRALRVINPSPYMYYISLKDFNIIGSSPEILVRKEGDVAITKPIAGTRYRGKDASEDIALISELKSDPKECAEHIMLVDLARNDLSRVCESGSVKVSEMMSVEKYSHVIHMVSTVIGKLKVGVDAFDLFKATFPAGTVTGAPKIRAMEIIDELEPVSRGIYAGAVGYFSYDGNMDLAITIRTIVHLKNVAYIQAGAGIVADSKPFNEYRETLNKAGALFKAIELSSLISSGEI